MGSWEGPVVHELAHLASLRNAAERRWSERRTEAAAAAELSACLCEESELLLACVAGLDDQIEQLKEWAVYPVGPQPTLNLQLHQMLFQGSPSPTASFAIPGINASVDAQPQSLASSLGVTGGNLPLARAERDLVTFTITPASGPWKLYTCDAACQSDPVTLSNRPHMNDMQVQVESGATTDALVQVQLVVVATDPSSNPTVASVCVVTKQVLTDSATQAETPAGTDHAVQAAPTLCVACCQTDTDLFQPVATTAIISPVISTISTFTGTISPQPVNDATPAQAPNLRTGLTVQDDADNVCGKWVEAAVPAMTAASAAIHVTTYPSMNIRSLSVQLQQALTAATLHRTRAQELEMTCRQLRAQLATTQRLLHAAHAGLMPATATIPNAAAPAASSANNSQQAYSHPISPTASAPSPMIVTGIQSGFSQGLCAQGQLAEASADAGSNQPTMCTPSLSIIAVAIAADVLQGPSMLLPLPSMSDTVGMDQSTADQVAEGRGQKGEEGPSLHVVSKVMSCELSMMSKGEAGAGVPDQRDANVRDQDVSQDNPMCEGR